MKYFFYSFFGIISVVLLFSAPAFAVTDNYSFYKTTSQASTACTASKGSGCSYFVSGLDTIYHYTNYSNSTNNNYYARTDPNTPCNPAWQNTSTNGTCSEPDLSAECQDVGDTRTDCLCSDGLPKNEAQYTTCDRPNLVACDFFNGRKMPVSQCPVYSDLGDKCPTDSTFQDGQCVNKCGINASYNAVTNKCQDNTGNEVDNNVCPSGYTQNVDGRCVPNSCPPKRKLVNNVCVIDKEPRIDTDVTTVINPDGSSSITTITTTTINNDNGTSSVSTNTTVVNKNQSGDTTGVSSETKETEEKPDEDESEVSGGGDCVSPPACSGDAIGCALVIQQWKTACLESDDEVSDATDCNTAFVCKGSVFECEALKLRRYQSCQFTASKVEDFIQGSSYKSVFDSSSDVNTDGILTSLSPSELDIGSSISISSISGATGRSGSCPSNVTYDIFGGSTHFAYGPICTTAIQSKPIFLFFVFLFCMKLVHKSVLRT